MNTVETRTKSESYTFTWRIFDVGDWVSPTSSRCVLGPGVYKSPSLWIHLSHLSKTEPYSWRTGNTESQVNISS